MKPNRFLLSCFVFLACFTIAFAQETPSQDTAETELDFEALLVAIKQADTPAQIWRRHSCSYLWRTPTRY